MSIPSLSSVQSGIHDAADDDVPGRRSKAPRRAGGGRRRRISLVAWFLFLSLVSVAAVSTTSAYLMSRFVTERMLTQDLTVTTEFINHIFGADHADRYFHRDGTGNPQLVNFFGQVARLPNVLRANIYLRDGTVLWSTDRSLIGRRFAENRELSQAAAGRPLYALGVTGGVDKEEHFDFGAPGRRFVENYVPMYQDGEVGGEVLGVMEIYRTPQIVLETIRAGDRLIFASAGIGALIIIGTLCWLVGRADGVMRRQEAAIATSERLATAGEMAAAVAHGLRNPLASIRSSAELAMRLRQPERVHALLDDIVVQSDRLEHWVRQYLRAADPEGSDVEADLAAVLATVRASFATELERYGITWREALAPGLPHLRIGAALLEQVLNSLVTNAVQAMPEGGEVAVTSRRDTDGTIEVLIADSGLGMSQEQLGRAFVPFATTKPTGLGLGLPLARRVLERHGASIALRSTPEHGTVAAVRLQAVA